MLQRWTKRAIASSFELFSRLPGSAICVGGHSAAFEGVVLKFPPRKIIGRWRQGAALDLQTSSSQFIGHDEYGHTRFDTVRPPLGESLYRLKNGSDKTAIDEIAEVAEHFIGKWKPVVDMIVPVPSSTPRPWQPVIVLAEAIGKRTGIPVVGCVTRLRAAPQLKNVFDLDERLAILAGLHAVDNAATQGKNVLLFDDLYRSGATMNSIAEALYAEGLAKDVLALTVTRTRSNQ